MSSNPSSSSSESANHRSLQFADVLPPVGEDLLPAVCIGPDSEHATDVIEDDRRVGEGAGEVDRSVSVLAPGPAVAFD